MREAVAALELMGAAGSRQCRGAAIYLESHLAKKGGRGSGVLRSDGLNRGF
jgi:hypothetical protein